MNKTQVGNMEHALNNGNRFYTEADNEDWNDLVIKGCASKHPGWERDMAYFRVTSEGKETLKLTDYQLGKLKHAFGLDYSRKPYRNYYQCNTDNNEWEDMCAKGYASKRIYKEDEIVYFGTLKGLREVFRRNVSQRYFEAINE